MTEDHRCESGLLWSIRNDEVRSGVPDRVRRDTAAKPLLGQAPNIFRKCCANHGKAVVADEEFCLRGQGHRGPVPGYVDRQTSQGIAGSCRAGGGNCMAA